MCFLFDVFLGILFERYFIEFYIMGSLYVIRYFSMIFIDGWIICISLDSLFEDRFYKL